jgi:hypothetical protein
VFSSLDGYVPAEDRRQVPYTLTLRVLAKFLPADAEFALATAAREPDTAPREATGSLVVAAEWLGASDEARAVLQRHDLTAVEYVSVLDALFRAVAVMEQPDRLFAYRSTEMDSNITLVQQLPQQFVAPFEDWKARLFPRPGFRR